MGSEARTLAGDVLAAVPHNFSYATVVHRVFVVTFGVLFLWAAVYKSVWPAESVHFVDAMLRSPANSGLIVKAVTGLELIVGTALLLGFRTRSMVLVMLMIVFAFSAALLWAKRAGYA